MDKPLEQIIIESFRVPEVDERVRLSDFLPGIFKIHNSKKAAKGAIKKGLVLINGENGYSGDYISGGEVIDLLRDEDVISKPNVDIAIEVCYEDEYLAIVNKPAGLLVSGNKRLTVENALPSNLKISSVEDALARPEPIHRLDYPTSGALLVGKTRQAVMLLNKVFEERKITKKYIAVSIGEQPKSGIIEKNVDGKNAKSAYEVLKSDSSVRFGFLNWVELTLYTGRRHQLRQHLASIGNPILGDAEYGVEGLILKGKGLYLHSYSLEFTHPISHKKIKVEVNPPKKFYKIFEPR